MFRCRNCGTPVGAGRPKGGDFIACADCLAKDSPRIPKRAFKERVNEQVKRTRRNKARGIR